MAEDKEIFSKNREAAEAALDLCGSASDIVPKYWELFKNFVDKVQVGQPDFVLNSEDLGEFFSRLGTASVSQIGEWGHEAYVNSAVFTVGVGEGATSTMIDQMFYYAVLGRKPLDGLIGMRILH